MATNANITVATVIQAAWAITLAKISGQSDLVVGLTINGRNASFPGSETAVGPCVDVVPVRATFGKQWNGIDLVRYIQDQQVARMPYENLGFREIIRKCTDWLKWSSRLQYFTRTCRMRGILLSLIRTAIASVALGGWLITSRISH